MIDGGVVRVDDRAVAVFADAFRGSIVQPHDAGYDQARRVWNAAIDRRPALVVRPRDPADVATAVRFATDQRLACAVRGGGHSVAGFGTCDDGLVIDLGAMNTVVVDGAARRAVVGPGALWADLDESTQRHGLAVPGGLISSTGVAGFTLGGGFGWLSRAYGLACDNLVEVDLVTASGEHLRVSDNEHPELFWALRGGGGNFGVVTSFTFALHEVGPVVLGGPVFHPIDAAAAVLRTARDLIASAPDQLFIAAILRRAPAAPFLDASLHGTPVIALGSCFCGPVEDGERLLAPVRSAATPVADLLAPRMYVELQRMLDASWGPGFDNYWKAEYLDTIDDDTIDAIVDAGRRITSPHSDIKLGFLGGAIARADPDASSYRHRAAPFVLNINARWEHGGDAALHVAWAQETWSATQPASAGGVYVNFLGDEGADRVRHAYGVDTYARLQRVKAAHDPDNVFRVNHNVPPDARAASGSQRGSGTV